MQQQAFNYGNSDNRVMDTSDYVYGRTLQKGFRNREHANVNNTYKDLFGEVVQNQEYNERFSRKNMDFATFGKPARVQKPIGMPYGAIAGDYLRHKPYIPQQQPQYRPPSQGEGQYQSMYKHDLGHHQQYRPVQDELDKLQSSAVYALQQGRPPSAQRGDESLTRLNPRDYQPVNSWFTRLIKKLLQARACSLSVSETIPCLTA
jgi:hypothetical protein